jgi:hypothetical protein
MNMRKALDDLKDSVNNLEGNIQSFHNGNISAYRVIAVQLRILLCDRNKGCDNSLIPRVFSNVRLHPLFGSMTKEEDEEWKKRFGHSLSEGLVFQMPAIIEFDGKGGSKIIKLFDERREPIPLQGWLDQDLFSKEISIRELIKSVANKLGAHSDPGYNQTLEFTKSVKLVDEDIHIKFIVGIGEYILKILNMTLEGNAGYLS